MLPGKMNYDALVDGFRWNVPERFNIGVAVCDRWAESEPQRLALIHVDADLNAHQFSYGALRDASNRLANLLRHHGVKRGDRVALLLPQTPETAIAHIAVYKLAAIAVPLAVLFGVDALSYRLRDCGAKVLIASAASLDKIAEVRHTAPELETVISIDGPADGVLDLHGSLQNARASFTPEDTGAEDPAIILYTSGTTGQPKGALHAHRILLGHVPGIQFVHEFLPQPGDSMWTPSDWAWTAGLMNVLMAGLYFGVPVVGHAFEKFDPDRAFRLIDEHRIRNLFIPPTALKIMRGAGTAASHTLKPRTLFSGGEAVGSELQEWAREELGVPINEGYGQTECNLIIESCNAIGAYRLGAMGRCVPGHSVAIIDGDGTPMRPGEIGGIAVQRPDPVMFIEYWRRPDATREKFVGDWMLTGDQGMIDDDGYFYFHGRDDDIITSSGYRIGPGEIEDCLLAHPAVAIAAAVGKPDSLRTEIVKAFIVLNEGFDPSPVLAREITDHVRTRLAAHEYPREISFEENLPLTTTGKVMRRLLRDRP
jgi:acetyl-CoA synthetase